MLAKKIVRGGFLIVALSAAVASVSCQSGEEGVVGTTQESTDGVYITGTVYCGSVIPPVPEPGVVVSVSYYDGGGWVLICQDTTPNTGIYCSGDLSNWWHQTVKLTAFKQGFGPYQTYIYLDDNVIVHDIYLYAGP